MRELTLSTFLKRTLKELSLNGQTAPFRLAKELDSNPRLLEPLCLYASLTMEETRKKHFLEKYKVVAGEFAVNRFLNCPQRMEEELSSLDTTNTYYKTWKSYLSVKNKKQADDHTKMLMHKRIRKLQEQKKISNYRVYTDLHLNPGNMNAYLKNGDSSKVALSTAREVLRYLQGL